MPPMLPKKLCQPKQKWLKSTWQKQTNICESNTLLVVSNLTTKKTTRKLMIKKASEISDAVAAQILVFFLGKQFSMESNKAIF